MKNVIKGMNKQGEGSEYWREKFLKISDAKLKDGIFIGPQIREIIDDGLFEHLLMETEKYVWLTFKAICLHFVGNVKAENYKKAFEELLYAHQTMGCNMSFNIYCLHPHLDFFPPNLGAVSDKHGEKFHQDISTMEKRCAGKWLQKVLADCSWNLSEEASTESYKRVSYRKNFYTLLKANG
jgi:hypothetical protein